MTATGVETNVPLLVAGVFAATFLVVGVIAYLFLLRPTPTETPAPAIGTTSVSSTPAVEATTNVQCEMAQPISLPLGEPALSPPAKRAAVTGAGEAGTPIGTIAPRAAAPGPTDEPGTDQRLLVRLYRALMFATGIAGLLASALMFSAVEGLSLLPFVAFLAAAFSVYSIYRGFVPDRELRARRR